MFKGNLNPPRTTQSHSHYFCDYIEMLALINAGDLVTLSDIKTRFISESDLGVETDNDEMKEMSQGGNKYAEASDQLDSKILSWFDILKNRKIMYGMGYPFCISENAIRTKNSISTKAKSYIFLLACSMLEKFNSNDKLTSIYEVVCCKAMKSYLPTIAQVHVFGKSALTSQRYTGSKYEKMNLLAKDLGMTHDLERDDYLSNDNGDGGLDVVAWIPFKDDLNKNKMEVYLGQCAAGKDWIKKQEEPRKVENAIPRLSKAKKIIFIPYDIRKSNCNFFHMSDLSVDMIFDRYRTYKVLNNIDDKWFFSTHGIKEVVSEITSYREPLF